MTSDQETEWVYSYNSGARGGVGWLNQVINNPTLVLLTLYNWQRNITGVECTIQPSCLNAAADNDDVNELYMTK